MKIDEKVLKKMFKTDKAIYNKLMLLKIHENRQ